MPGQNKKWDDKAERDLCLAIILGKHDSQRYDWPAIHKIMTDIGHGFTKDAISQHFTKSIMKEFKNRHGEVVKTLSAKKAGGSDTPTTPKKRAKFDDNDKGEDNFEMTGGSSAKRVKSKTLDDNGIPIKLEGLERSNRERSQTARPDSGFENWMGEGRE